MSDSPTDSSPATSAGTTRPAGAGLGDQEMAKEVAGSTSSDLEVEEAFAREGDGAASGTEAAKATADELR